MPQLNIDKIKVKIDTGARTSALHAFHVKTYEERNLTMVKFQVHPIQRQTKTTVDCIAPLLEYREVTSSAGHTQKKLVILTPVKKLG